MASGGMLGQALKSSQDVRERLQGVDQGMKSGVIRNSCRMGWTVAAAAAFACGVPRYLGKCTRADPGSNALLCSKPVGLHSLQGRIHGDIPVADIPPCAQSALWSQSSLNPSSHSFTRSYPLPPTPSLQSSQQREQVEPHFRRNVVFFPQTPPTPTPPHPVHMGLRSGI